MRYALLAALVAAISVPAEARGPKPETKSCPALPAAFEGTAFAGDGDTLFGVGFPASVRLFGMNAPEVHLGHRNELVPGMVARAYLVDLMAAADNKVSCKPISWDRHCRIVATCESGGKDLSLEMLKAGMAYGYFLAKDPPSAATAVAYSNAEVAARKAKAGLWPYWMGERGP